jgi:hypothetical protein
MEYSQLLNRAMEGITQLGHGDKVRILKHAVDLKELTSCLREYVFHTDAKTTEFLKGLRQTPNP